MENFIEYLYSKFLQSDGVSIDTRTIKKNNLFFALNGPNFNANKYALQALEMGAAFAVVDQEEYVTDPRIILAENSEKALQDLAVFHRSRFKRKVLGITGSNGKTTTKELVARVLSQKYITHATAGNYNNHLGVPITLLHIYPQVEVAVIEMGANHVGEIAQLCSFAHPTHGLITNIGEAHTELFGGIEGVLRGKSELFDYLKKTDGLPFINADDPRLANMAKRFDQKVLFPAEDLKMVSVDPYLTIQLNEKTVATHLIGKYNFGNIAAAVAVGRAFDIADDLILEAIASYIPSNQRSQVIEKGSVKIINDCYNANPSSMMAALENLSLVPGKKTVILGDMKEVENSEEKHQEIGKIISDYHFDQVILIGPEMNAAKFELPNAYWFDDVEELHAAMHSFHFKNSTVLVKASRSIRLDKVAEWIVVQ